MRPGTLSVPPWITASWILFSPFLNGTLERLRVRPLLTTISGPVFCPLRCVTDMLLGVVESDDGVWWAVGELAVIEWRLFVFLP
jgi:hypothetical protein